MTCRFVPLLTLALLTACAAPAPEHLAPAPPPPLLPAEGMWLFNRLPTRHLEREFGFTPTKPWLDHLRLSSIRMGASGAFVSADGLLLTNHHVASGGLQNASTPQHDYATQGFLARSRTDELKLPGIEISILQDIVDVTRHVNAPVPPTLTGEPAVKARNAAIADIERDSLARTGLHSTVVTLYGGAQYHLYRYKRYTDIRCAFAPESAIAFFGGDPDNFEYPRYDLDIALLRAYENGRPARVKHFLKLAPEGVREGDLLFVSGHPGSTSRLLPFASLQALRETLPLQIDASERLERALQAYSALGPEQRRQAQHELFGVQNSLKAAHPRLAALTDDFLARKRAQEDALRQRLHGRPELPAYDAALTAIAAAEARRREIHLAHRLLEGGFDRASTLLGHARTLLRIEAEDAKPDADRLPEYTHARRDTLESRLLAEIPIYPDLEIARLTEFLTFHREKLGVGHPLIAQVLDGKSPSTRARELITGTRLATPAERKRLLAVGASTSTDPLLQLVLALEPSARALRSRHESEVDEPLRRALTAIHRARFAVYGTALYPDATGTLRLSFGTVQGYPQDGARIPAFTTFGGAFDHESAHDAQPPYKLPASWHAARNALAPHTPFNFVATTDITGGNSGSPAVNRRGELVGVLFDSNRQGVANTFAYTDDQARAIFVDVRALLESLRTIYHAAPLVGELLGQQR